MKARIRFLPDERLVLMDLYRRFRIPTDQYFLRPDVLFKLTKLFNSLTGNTCRSGELLRYMVKERKQANWHRFDGNHRKLGPPPDDELTPDEWVALGKLYVEFGITTDEMVFEDDLADDFERRFALLTGKILGGRLLLALLVKKRKRGLLPCLRVAAGEFGDIEQVARAHAARKKMPG